ncbi:hypothetical protein ACFUYE_00465 [Micromonospora humida]|uniref:hypothetical protein n=1 Tax=Micromonospora humida TaxID=2809018 RepID=UPI003670A165
MALLAAVLAVLVVVLLILLGAVLLVAYAERRAADDAEAERDQAVDAAREARRAEIDLRAQLGPLRAELSVLAEVAAAVAPTVTITPPAAAVRFLHQLHKDWVKTAHEHLAQVDKLTAELAEVRAAALAPGEIETATRFLNAYLRLAGSRVPADHRLRALVAKLAGMTSTEAATR